MPLFRHILAPTDFSEAATRALRLAVELARAHGAELTVLAVGVPPSLYGAGMGPHGTSSALWSEVDRRLTDERGRLLEQVVAAEIPDSIHRHVTLREGYPTDEILAEAAERGADLIVMGTHGRTGVNRVFLGSVTARVLRNATIPVLITH